MSATDRTCGGVLLAFALVVVFESSKLPIGQPSAPGPGFFPFWTAIIMAILSLGLVVRGGAATPSHAISLLTGCRQALLVVVAIAIYTLLLEQLGYIVATCALLATLFLLERQTWGMAAGASLGISVGSYWIFAKLLGLPLPQGVLPI
jgi:putative tricarboxylic transport membrane protein